MKQIADRLEAHQAVMYDICLRILRHPQDAEDACQEAMIEAARQADTVREDFGAWARRVATTTALDVRRRRGRRRAHERAVLPPTAKPPVEIEPALAALDEPSRKAVEQHYLDGRPLRELAREAGVSEVAVWKRLRKSLRVMLAAMVPALMAAAAMLVVLRDPVTEPELPVQDAREPWPYEMPPRTWPEPVRKAWKATQLRVTMDVKDVPMSELMKMLSQIIGHPIRIAPEAIEPEEVVTLKVEDLVADGTLKLVLMSRLKGYRILDDGTIWVAPAEQLDAAGPDRAASEEVRRAELLQTAARHEGPSMPLATAEAMLSRRIREPQGRLPLDEYVAGLCADGLIGLVLDAAARTKALAELRVNGRGEEDSLQAHLHRALRGVDLVPVPGLEGLLLLTRASLAADLRASDAWRSQKRLEQAVDGPFDGEGVRTVPQLARRLEKFLGAPVLTTKEAWESPAVVASSPGATPRQVLDGLSAVGFRWAVRDGALFLLR